MRSVTLNSVYFCNSVDGWAVGRNAFNSEGVIFRTTDGGAMWEYGEAGIYCNMVSVFAIDEKHALRSVRRTESDSS